MAILALVGALAAPASAGEAPPTELWREYPLEPPATVETPAPAAPFRPPVTAPSTAVGVALPTGGEDDKRFWWIALGLALASAPVAFLVARRRLYRMSARVARRAGAALGRPARPSRPVFGRVLRGDDPSRAVAPGVWVACVVRREGVIRSRFVAELQPPVGQQRTIASSRRFWRRPRSRRPSAEDEERQAWESLLGGLASEGWEVVPPWGAAEGVRPDTFGAVPGVVQLVRARAPLPAAGSRPPAAAHSGPTEARHGHMPADSE